MHETLRRRILRRLETLPEERLYQVLDYIEFLESRYAERPAAEPGGLQSMAERLEDELRKRTLSPATLREAFQLVSAADRVFHSLSEAGKEILQEVQGATAPREGAPRRGDVPTGGGPEPGSPAR